MSNQIQELYETLLDAPENRVEVENELIEAALPIVTSTALQAVASWPDYYHLRDDLVSVGHLALVSFVRKLHGEPGKNVGGLIHKVIKRAMYRFLYKELEQPNLECTIDPVDQSCDYATMSGILDCCIDRYEKQIVHLRMSGMSIERIGEKLQMSCGTVSNTLSDILDRYEV